MVYIGIDLGTTYSCVSVVENGKPVIILSDDGKHTVPSVVAYCGNEIVVGNASLNCEFNTSDILYDSKRLIGQHDLTELSINDYIHLWPFTVENKNNTIGYILKKSTSNGRFLTPEEVSAEILKKLKASAEKYLDSQKVTGAVITIPAIFNASQIAATKKAAELAGLELKYLLQEPAATAIAYNNSKKIKNSKILIFDFGGGTLDISIVDIRNETYIIQSAFGDAYLGGQDFDCRILDYAIKYSLNNLKIDVIKRPKLVNRLRSTCKLCKEALSFLAETYNIHLDISDEREINIELTTIKFNELCAEFFERTMNQIDETLKNSNLSDEDIDHVILVGGSSRIPEIRKRLGLKFGKSKLKNDINPDEAVAYGAAILADAIEKEKEIPLINSTMNELIQNINNLQVGGDNSLNNSHKILFYVWYQNNNKSEGRICLFNSYTCSAEEIAKLHNDYEPYQVATTQNKIFGINGGNKLLDIEKTFEIYDLNTRQISKGPDPPEWRNGASVVYFKDKLYYLSGWKPKAKKDTNRVDVLIDGKWQTGPAFPLPISHAQAIICDGILYVIDGLNSNEICKIYKIYRLSDDEREWIEIGEIPEKRIYSGVASLNGKIYITGGR